MVEDETPSADCSTSAFEPTGWRVATYSSTTSRRISCCLSERTICIPSMVGVASGEEPGGHAAAEQTAARSERERSLVAGHEAAGGESAELRLVEQFRH